MAKFAFDNTTIGQLYHFVRSSFDEEYAIESAYEKDQTLAAFGAVASEMATNPVGFSRSVASSVAGHLRKSVDEFPCLKIEKQAEILCAIAEAAVPSGFAMKLLGRAKLTTQELAKISKIARGKLDEIKARRVAAKAESRPKAEFVGDLTKLELDPNKVYLASDAPLGKASFFVRNHYALLAGGKRIDGTVITPLTKSRVTDAGVRKKEGVLVEFGGDPQLVQKTLDAMEKKMGCFQVSCFHTATEILGDAGVKVIGADGKRYLVNFKPVVQGMLDKNVSVNGQVNPENIRVIASSEKELDRFLGTYNKDPKKMTGYAVFIVGGTAVETYYYVIESED